MLAVWGPGSLDAQRFNPPPVDPLLNELFAVTMVPSGTEPDLPGAEDLEPGPNGRLYAGLEDGRIVAREADGGWSTVASTVGRPLGLAFGPDGRLHVADPLRGVLRLEVTGSWTTLAPVARANGLTFADDLAVLEDGSVAVTDASSRYPYGRSYRSAWAGDHTGRLVLIQPNGYQAVLADALSFANGVAYDPATRRLFIAESWAGRVLEVNPTTGTSRVLIEGLPGYPDNLQWDGDRQELWIAMPAPRSPQLDRLHPHPILKRFAWRLCHLLPQPGAPSFPTLAMAVDRTGASVRTLFSPPAAQAGITVATPWQGSLWVSGGKRESVTVYDLEP